MHSCTLQVTIRSVNWRAHLNLLIFILHTCNLFALLLCISKVAATSVWFCHRWPCSGGLLCNNNDVFWQWWFRRECLSGWCDTRGLWEKIRKCYGSYRDVCCCKNAICSWSNIFNELFSNKCLEQTLVLHIATFYKSFRMSSMQKEDGKLPSCSCLYCEIEMNAWFLPTVAVL